ncbi:MAG: NAD(P)/FAD-dependent oxidoreductase [Planctomycetota bacterium]
MTGSDTKYDALILGAGMSGLAAGIRLAQYDLRVAILEKHYLWGGLNSFFKRSGRRFDVGLHALTNYVPKGTRGAPLTKLLRQLRIPYDALKLGPQSFSEIRFPGTCLRFSNDFELLESEVARDFPRSLHAFRKLVNEIREMDAFGTGDSGPEPGAREMLAERLPEPRLIEMLLVPICFYGSARENDIDWTQFVILFRSLFLEGFARPEGGMKPLLDLLRERYLELGGELRMRCGVEQIVHEDGVARGVVLEDGTQLEAERILSSAGFVETMRLADLERPKDPQHALGRLSFVESMTVIDTEPRELGHDATITFFNDGETFRYGPPEDDALVDPTSGVYCVPNNYACESPLPEGLVRVTTLASPTRWSQLTEEEYATAKQESYDAALDVVAAAGFGFDPRPRAVYTDVFTPRTIEKYTSHPNGAVYGAPHKQKSGETELDGLYLCGTDQGFLGIVGAMLSGVSMANAHVLSAVAAR